jgi:hypothetical protein
MKLWFAALATLGVVGCASSPAYRQEIGAVPDSANVHAPLHDTDAPNADIESIPPAEVVSLDESAPTEVAAPAPDVDGAAIADSIVHGEYPAPQDAPPPTQGSAPPPKVVYVQQPPPNVVYVQQPPPPPPPFHRSRFTLKGGYYSFQDSARLDDGYIIEGTWMNFFTPNFATEGEIGYVEADGKHNGIKSDLWGIPFMINARVSIPLKTLELYGGGGIGSIYYDVNVDPGADVSGWVAAADTFFGVCLNLKNGIVVGAEWKYFFTESVHNLDGGLDSYAAMLTLGFAR